MLPPPKVCTERFLNPSRKPPYHSGWRLAVILALRQEGRGGSESSTRRTCITAYRYAKSPDCIFFHEGRRRHQRCQFAHRLHRRTHIIPISINRQAVVCKMKTNSPRYKVVSEPPHDRFMIFDVVTDQPANVDGVLLIGLSQQDAEWVFQRLKAGVKLNRKYLEALKSIADRRTR